jgi:hypothetical protein
MVRTEWWLASDVLVCMECGPEGYGMEWYNDDQDENWDTEDQFIESLEQFVIANEKAANGDDHEAVNKETESRKYIFPGHNAANAGKTGLDGKVGGTRSDPPEVVGKDNAGDVKTRPAVRHPVGESDPESELPCSCPRRTFMDPPEEMPMAATASNRKALEEFIRKHCKTSAFNTCKRGLRCI